MSINKFLMEELFNTPDTTGGPRAPMGREGILDALNKGAESKNNNDTKNKDSENPDDLEIEEPDDVDPDVVDDKDEDDTEGEKDKGKDKEEEKDELEELEEELKGPKEEDLELTTPVRKREILAKYPKIFEDFPHLEKAYYRELEFTKLLPTIQDAKDAVQAVNTLNAFEADLKEGKMVDLFKAIIKDDSNAFAKLADSYMENLALADEKAYHHVLGNITKDIVETMVRAGKKTNNKELQDAATQLYQFMFGDVEWKPKQKLSIDDNDNSERKQLENERREFETTKLTEKRNEIMTATDNRLKSVIDANIDKKNQMTPFVKKNAVKEVKDKLDSLLKSDSRFQAVLTKLWDRARESKYSRNSLDAIETAITSKSRSLLPTVIVSVKKEALKGISTTRKRESSKPNESNEDTRETATTRNRADNNERNERIDKNKPLPGESSIDFLTRRARN